MSLPSFAAKETKAKRFSDFPGATLGDPRS